MSDKSNLPESIQACIRARDKITISMIKISKDAQKIIDSIEESIKKTLWR